MSCSNIWGIQISEKLVPRTAKFKKKIFIFSENLCFKNCDLLTIWRGGNGKQDKIDLIFNYILDKIGDTNVSNEYEGYLRKKIEVFSTRLNIKWQKSKRSMNVFNTQNNNTYFFYKNLINVIFIVIKCFSDFITFIFIFFYFWPKKVVRQTYVHRSICRLDIAKTDF